MADILIIANPASGKFKIRKPLLNKIMVLLQEKADKVELALTEYRGHGTYLAQNSSSHIIIYTNTLLSAPINVDTALIAGDKSFEYSFTYNLI